MRRTSLIILLLLLASLVFAAGVVARLRWRPPTGASSDAPAVPTFVGRAACIECHATQHELFAGSHHDRAMEVADDTTVLGDFDDATFAWRGVTSTFSRRDGRFVVRTDGPDGAIDDFEVEYTFGIDPLQQYLVALPGGRYQALATAWDTRPAAEGGQRWFHLQPDETIDHTDPLHWTKGTMNWNSMCAECHSTNLEKRYDGVADAYDTTWSEIDVSCEACHGPGSEHLEWADIVTRGGPDLGRDKRLVVKLKDDSGGAWQFEPGVATAKRSAPRRANEIEACARCHARRGAISASYEHGRALLDTHRLALLDDALYHADGQILDEVYVYGSFVQSKMYREGVTCSDCHEAHGATLRAPRNALCIQCHRPEVFDTPEHHFHVAGGPGSACVDCHMPARTYMVVDPRRDHSLRVPRPDLSLRLGTPNACTDCHQDQSDSWAADAVVTWYGPEHRAETHFGEALHAGRTAAPGAGAALAALAGNGEQPGIARATALSLVPRYPDALTFGAVTRALDDPDPLVRAAAVAALVMAPPADYADLALPLLEDPVRAVRLSAARVLARVDPDTRSPAEAEAIRRGMEAYCVAESANAERPESHLNIGVVLTDAGRLDEAEAAYLTALRLDPAVLETTVNLVDLYRVLGREADGEAALRAALEHAPEAAVLHHVLGLLLVRTDRLASGIASLGRAAELGPEIPRYAYVYAVGLDEVGRRTEALAILEAALIRHPADRDLLGMLNELRD